MSRPLLYTAIATALLPGVWLMGAEPPSVPRTPAIIAHRGASRDAPENTLAAVRLAWQRKADAVEIDVHLSKDRRVVVLHDATTRRTAGQGGKVADQTLAQLRRLDVGQHKSAKWAGERIPTVEEVLATVPKGKRLFVEIKCSRAVLAPLAAALANSGLAATQVEIIGFDLQTMTAAKKRLPNHPVHWLCAPKKHPATGQWKPSADEMLAKIRRAGLDGLDLAANPAIDKPFVQTIHAAGKKLYVWTVDDPAKARRLQAAGVDAITTNRPGHLRTQLGSAPPIPSRAQQTKPI